jgi:hypothetical protein
MPTKEELLARANKSVTPSRQALLDKMNGVAQQQSQESRFKSADEIASYISGQEAIKNNQSPVGTGNLLDNFNKNPFLASPAPSNNPILGGSAFPQFPVKNQTPTYNRKSPENFIEFAKDKQVEKKRLESPAASPFTLPGMDNFDATNAAQSFSALQNSVVKNLEMSKNPEASKLIPELYNKLNEFSNTRDFVGMKKYVQELDKKGLIPDNSKHYFENIVDIGDSYDPEVRAERQKVIDANKAKSDQIAGHNKLVSQDVNKVKEKINSLKNLQERNKALGLTPFTESEQKMIAASLEEQYKKLHNLQSNINQNVRTIQAITGDKYAGLTPEEADDKKAEDTVIKKYDNEWTDFLKLYDLNPTAEGLSKAKDMKFDQVDKASINQSVGDYLNQLENVDPDQFIRTMGQSQQEIMKDWAYKYFWPKFKQAVSNYDHGSLNDIIENIDGGQYATAHGLRKYFNENGALPNPNEEESLGKEEMGQLIRQAVLVNYMMVKGKDVSEFFGNDNPETGGLLLGRNSKDEIVAGAVPSIIGGGTEKFLSGLSTMIGYDSKTGARSINDDMNTHGTVVGDFKSIMDQAGVNIPTNLQEWTKPTNYDRVVGLGQDAVKIMGEFATIDLALLKGAKFLKGAEALSKGTKLANLGAKTTARFTALADETAILVKGLDTVAKTSSSPIARALAKVTLGGGNMLTAGAKYELVNQAFDDEAVTFTSGMAGSLARGVISKSPIGKIFAALPDNKAKDAVFNFFSKGLGEVGKMGAEQISIQGLDGFMETMKDEEEKAWFLGTTFLMGALMGGKNSKIQDWALKHRESMSPEARQNFDILTQRDEIGKVVNGEVKTLNRSDFNNLVAEKLKGTEAQQAAWRKQSEEHTNKTIEEIYAIKGKSYDKRMPVSDSQKLSIQEENYNRMRRGSAPMNKAQTVDFLLNRKSSRDVSNEYNEGMTQEERLAAIDKHISESANEGLEGVWSNIKKIEDPQVREAYNEKFRAAQEKRTRRMNLIKDNLDETPKVDSEANKEKIGKILTDLESETPLKKAYSGFERLFMDEGERLRKVYERASKEGIKVSEATDAYFQKSLARGKAAAKSKEVIRHFGDMIDRMNKDGVDMKTFDELLYAQTALEKNAELRNKANDLSPEEKAAWLEDRKHYLSGMTDETATQLIKDIKDSGQWDKYKAYEKEYREKIINPILEEKLNEGIISPKEYELLKSTYEYYAPTKIDPEKVGLLPASVRNEKKNTGFIGKGIQALKGGKIHYTERVSPFFQGVSDNMATHMSVESNNVNKSLKKFIQENGLSGSGAKDIFEIVPARYIDGKEVTKDVPNSIAVRDGGKKSYIVIRNAKLLKAMKGGMNDADLNAIMSPLNKITSWKRQVETSLNPAFIPKNMIRDLGFAYARLEQMGIGKEGRSKFFSNVKQAWKGVRDSQKGVNSEWAMHLKDLEQHGGASTHVDYAKAETRIKDLQDAAKEMTKEKSVSDKALSAIKKRTTQVVSDLNQAAEMSVRLATYKSAIDSGMSKEAAALAAKEVTVNFDRKGQWSHVSNSLFMFSNAQLQGTKNVAHLIMKSPRGRAFAASLAATALAVNGLNELLGSDEEIDGITEFDKQKSLTIINPFTDKKGDYIRIPVPQGLDSFKYMGDMIYDVANGKKSVEDVSDNWITHVLSGVSPLEGPTLSQAVAPTVIDPFIQHSENVAYFGGPLYPETHGKESGTVMSQKYFGHPSALSKKVAEFVNYASGGSKQTKGRYDFSPNAWDNYFKWIGGGAGEFVSNVITLSMDAAKMDMGDVETRDIPIYSAFARDGNALTAYKTQLYKWKDVSSATILSADEMSEIVSKASRLVEVGELEPSKASEMMKEIQKNQWLIGIATDNDMTVDEVREQLKSK